MPKSVYHYVCLDCHLAPQVSIEGRVSLPVVASSYKGTRHHVRQYNHRVAAVNAFRKIVRVYFLDEKNRFNFAAWKQAPPF